MDINPQLIAVGASLLAVAGQLLNFYLHLRIRNAILESEKSTMEKVDRDFVREKTCQARIEARLKQHFDEHAD